MPERRKDWLHVATTNILIDAMPDPLKESLDRSLSMGVTREELLEHARKTTGGPGGHKGGMTYLQIHAYLFPERREVD